MNPGCHRDRFYYHRKSPGNPAETDLDELSLPIRVHNSLNRSNVYTVEELLGLSESELLGLFNVGKQGLNELKKTVQEYLAENGIERTFPRKEKESDPLRINLQEQCQSENENLFADPLELSISSLGLSENLLTDLSETGLESINQLLVLTEDELKSVSQAVCDRYLGLISRIRLYLIKNGIELVFPARPLGTPAETILEQAASDLTVEEEA